MPQTLEQQLDELDHLTTGELCDRYAQLFGQPVRTRHKAYLIRKVAWRIQALAEGDLSERALRRAEELACDADVRLMPPKPRGVAHDPPRPARVTTVAVQADPRLPRPGAAIEREYKGRTHRVIVLPPDEGFEYEGQRYKTLTAVAEAITGSHINGFRFFCLETER